MEIVQRVEVTTSHTNIIKRLGTFHFILAQYEEVRVHYYDDKRLKYMRNYTAINLTHNLTHRAPCHDSCHAL